MTCASGKLKAISLVLTLSSTDSSLMGALRYVMNFTHWITGVAKKASNSFDQKCLEHLMSRLYPIPIAPQPSPCHPGPSISIDDSFKGSLTENQAHHGTGKEPTKLEGGQCTYTFVQNTADCSLLTGAM